MATNVIKIRRTTGSTAPGTLNAGELAFSGGSGTQGNMGQRLFIGDPANSNAVTVIGGNYFSNLMDHAHGTTTASSGLIVDANKSTSELRTGALYLGTSGSDTLVTSTAAELNTLDGITSTAAELNLLDGVSGLVQADFTKLAAVDSTAAELNIVDGGTSATSTTLADADRLVVNDNGTMVQVALTDLETYMETSLDTLSNVTSVGTLTALTVDDVAINGKVVTMTGSSGDTATMTVGTNGTFDLTTVDTAAAAANMTLTADGTFEAVGSTITLDSGGAINLEPASGSAILLDGTISVDAGVVTGATSITSTAFVGTLSTAAQTNVTSLGTLTALTVDYVVINGTTIGHTGDTDLMTVASGVLTVAGEVDATSLDISGDADIDGTTNLDNTDIDGSLTVDGAIDLNATTLDIDASDVIDIDTYDLDFEQQKEIFN